jgi:hypothetical protein
VAVCYIFPRFGKKNLAALPSQSRRQSWFNEKLGWTLGIASGSFSFFFVYGSIDPFVEVPT